MGNPFEKQDVVVAAAEAGAEAFHKELFTPTQDQPSRSAPQEAPDFLDLPPLEGTKPADKVKETYRTAETDKAVQAAIENHLPVVARVGAYAWCPACRKMDDNVWPKIEKEFKGKAVFLDVDVDDVKKGLGGDLAKEIAKKTESYPTTMILNPKQEGYGINVDDVKSKYTEGMTLDETRKFLRGLKEKE